MAQMLRLINTINIWDPRNKQLLLISQTAHKLPGKLPNKLPPKQTLGMGSVLLWHFVKSNLQIQKFNNCSNVDENRQGAMSRLLGFVIRIHAQVLKKGTLSN